MINSDFKPTELRIWVNNNWRGVNFTGYREIAAPHLQRREGGASSSSL